MKRYLTAVLALCMVIALCACGSSNSSTSVLDTKVFRVVMECAYAPYNWTQEDDSNGAVPIFESGDYANGYDVMIAKQIADANGWTLEIHKMDWDSIPLAVQSGAVDAGICGQSITSERLTSMDFSDPYYYASIVTLTTADSPYASAQGLSDLAGAVCSSQINTVWYDTCLPQIENADIQAAQNETAQLYVGLNSGLYDLIVVDEPTAMAACVANPNFVLLNFYGTDDDFEVSAEEINIGISVQKGNSGLVEICNRVLAGMNEENPNVYTDLMDEATAIQPLSE